MLEQDHLWRNNVQSKDRDAAAFSTIVPVSARHQRITAKLDVFDGVVQERLVEADQMRF